MRDRMAHAIRQAMLAREKAALPTNDQTKAEWLRLADLWEELAREYRKFEKLREPP